MHEAQITARVNPDLKKNFTAAAQRYGLPVSGLLAMFMRMVVEGEFVPAFNRVYPDRMRTPELEAAAQEARAEYKAGKTISLATVMRKAWYTA